MKIAINTCYGGFHYSQSFLAKYPNDINLMRNDAQLIQDLENFGPENASDSFSRITIVEIPDDVTDYEIEEYDGCEAVIWVKDGKINHTYY